jgi:hypothetical protein
MHGEPVEAQSRGWRAGRILIAACTWIAEGSETVESFTDSTVSTGTTFWGHSATKASCAQWPQAAVLLPAFLVLKHALQAEAG